MKDVIIWCLIPFLILACFPSYGQVTDMSTSRGTTYLPGNAYFGANDYIEYHAGNLPIIISAPHGGSLTPSFIPDRACGNCVTVKDTWTEELAYEIDSAIRVVFGGYPHIIINKLSRKKLDANREIVEAALGNSVAEAAWYEYHNFMQAAKDSCVAQFGSAIYIDLHAHGHAKQRIELGYLLNRTELQAANGTLDAMSFQDSSSIRHLTNVLNPTASFSEILRGSACMGEFLENRGYPSVPSPLDPAPLPTDPFFAGGYNTVRHGSRDSSRINGIQFETHFNGIRNSNANRHAFSRALACVLRSYLDQWYVDLDSWDAGHVVTSTADAGPGSLRSALLGAEAGTVITFDPALNGDTIRLQNELQVCTDITLQGPGEALLAISGEDTTRILRVMPGTHVEVAGLSLVRGHSPEGEDGGAVLTYGSIRLSQCTLANNFAADDGGALAVADSNAIAQLDTCQVMQNSCGDDGGALRCYQGELIVNASTVQDNVSPSYGGGLSMNGTVIIRNSTFSGNQASGDGGGIRNFGSGSLTCLNTTIVGNMCGIRGGGISTASSAEIDFCTIVENQASSFGGGIRVSAGGICSLRNTLLAYNTGSTGDDISVSSGMLVSNGYNLVRDTTGSAWIPATAEQLGNAGNPLTPQIMPLDTNGGLTRTVALQVGSPCIDQGDSTGAPLLDQRGNIRIAGLHADIGSYEFCLSSTAIDVQSACNSFTWIDGNTYTSSNTVASHLLTNAAGCDSVVTLDLTIIQVDTSVTQTGTSLSANANGASYQWLDCENGMRVLAGETHSSFVPLASGTYAVEVTQNGCVDTSACYSVIPVGMVENDFDKMPLVFPNPTAGKIGIALDARYPSITVHIYDSAGKLLQTAGFQHAKKMKMDIVGAAGYYMVEILAGDKKKAVIKIVKE